jgi:hypothetical protein
MGGGCIAIIPDQIACGSQNKEHWSCEAFLTIKTSGKERLDR